MCGLKSVGLLVILAFPLFAQEPVDDRQLGTYKGSDESMRSIMTYCDAVDQFAREQPPRIFAEINQADPNQAQGKRGSEFDPARWKEFADRDAWTAAGKPSPLVFVWEREGATVGVTVIAHTPRNWNPAVAYGRLTYCYNAQGTLARIRALWHLPVNCEFLFPCALLTDRQFFVGTQSLAISDWVFTPDGAIQKLRNGKEVDDYFDPSSWLTVEDLHLKTADQLPFKTPRIETPKK